MGCCNQPAKQHSGITRRLYRAEVVRTNVSKRLYVYKGGDYPIRIRSHWLAVIRACVAKQWIAAIVVCEII